MAVGWWAWVWALLCAEPSFLGWNMQYLEVVSRRPDVSWYRLLGEHQGAVTRWVVSTPETVAICNRPEVLGVEYTDKLAAATTRALATAPFRGLLESVPSSSLCVMNFLRGSLNFELRNAVARALNSNDHVTCFMSSQRFRESGRWHVKENMYRKIHIPTDAVLLFGDVVATGVTLDSGLEVLVQHMVESRASVKGIVFFTIGCHKIEKYLLKYDELLRKSFPGYEQTHVVYFEGKMKMVDSSTKLVIGIPGTDLIKLDALLAPEFEFSQYEDVAPVLERCVIYDAGSRSFDAREYLADVAGYWRQVQGLGKRGYTLREALMERWPEGDYQSFAVFRERKGEKWRGVDDSALRALYDAYLRRWEGADSGTFSAEALVRLCDERLAALKSGPC